MCCPDHLASFAITMPIDIAFDRKATTTWFLVVFNFLFISSILIACYLDASQTASPTSKNLTPSKKQSKDEV
jgi:hypothetical protein